ncbi:MAG: type II secretion system F family protein [Phycisphaeraceae bacterium]|nr:type II secretion system F family protein [Phycisphaeraceae bacterium]
MNMTLLILAVDLEAEAAVPGMSLEDLLIQVAVLLLVFVSTFMVVWSIFRYPVPLEPPVHRRLALALGAGQRQTLFEQPLLMPMLAALQQVAARFNVPSIRQMIRSDLNASGNPKGYSVDEFLALSLLSGIAVLLFASVMTWLLIGMPEPFLILIGALVGFGLPIYLLHNEARSRVMRISKRLPYTLDLIALMMASGATFSEAISTVIRDEPDDDFNQELSLVQSEMEFGASRAVALKNMANRIPLEPLRSVVGAINQSEALGTPLSTILKTQSSMMRMHRSVRAEKLAASASLRILIPSMLILIAVVIIALGPMVLRAIATGSLFGSL